MSVQNPFELLVENASNNPDGIAVASTGLTLTWHEMHDLAVRFASRLRKAGVKPGQVVAISANQVIEAVLIAAVFHEAAISCTLPKNFKETAEFKFDWLFSAEPNAAFARRNVVIDDQWVQAASYESLGNPMHEYEDEQSICRLVFSSGTTGNPKAVPFSIKNIHYRTVSAANYWMPEQPFMALLALPSVSGFQTYFASLSLGHTYFAPGNAIDNAQLIAKYQVKAIKASPIQLSELLAEAKSQNLKLESLKVIESAGSTLPDQLAVELERYFGAQVVNLYGSSEVGTVATRTALSQSNGLAGKIVGDVEVQIVDEHLNQLAAGETGTIRIKRAHQALGYFRNSEASETGFKQGWFYPGDRGYIQGDQLYLAGRTSELLNAAGVKVDPNRIEQVALEFEGIEDAAAFTKVLENSVEVIALAVVSSKPIDAQKLSEFLKVNLGDAAPKYILRKTEISRTLTGKVLRSELK